MINRSSTVFTRILPVFNKNADIPDVIVIFTCMATTSFCLYIQIFQFQKCFIIQAIQVFVCPNTLSDVY